MSLPIPRLQLQVDDTFSEGIHGFLFVINMGNPPFTEEDYEAFEFLKEVPLNDNILTKSQVNKCIQEKKPLEDSYMVLS